MGGPAEGGLSLLQEVQLAVHLVDLLSYFQAEQLVVLVQVVALSA